MLRGYDDVLISTTTHIPMDAQPYQQARLGDEGHRFSDSDRVQVWEHNGEYFAEVLGSKATLLNAQSSQISLPRGLYRIWKKQHYVTPTLQ
jgi:hypothetical protein